MTQAPSSIADVRPPRFAWIAAAWLVLGVTDALQGYARNRARGEQFDALETLVGPLPAYAILAVLTPVVFGLARRMPLNGGSPRAIALHTGVSFLFPIVHLACSALSTAVTFRILGRVDVAAEPLMTNWLGSFYAADVLRYWALVGAWHAFANHDRAHRSALEAERARHDATALAATASEMRLRLLTSQLRPHFLFNALNVIDGLVVAGDTRRASKVIVELARLLRLALADSATVGSLSREVELVLAYLAVEQARLGSRLSVTIDVPDDLATAQVPTLILQLLVENAVHHGVAAVPGPGWIAVRAFREGERLQLEVSNSGLGLAERVATRGVGIGLSNVRERLHQLYGDAAWLRLTKADDGGVVALVSCPLAKAAR